MRFLIGLRRLAEFMVGFTFFLWLVFALIAGLAITAMVEFLWAAMPASLRAKLKRFFYYE